MNYYEPQRGLPGERKRLQESKAWGCRWFDVLYDIDEMALSPLGECEVLADFSVNDYQGEVSVAFLDHAGNCRYVEYTYGSCSGCDQWEDQGDEAARADILRGMVTLEPPLFVKFAAEHRALQAVLDQMTARLFP